MNYNRIGSVDLAYFCKVLGDERVLANEKISEDFTHDELYNYNKYPDVVLHPKTTEEVSKILKYANDKIIPVTCRGQGTGLVGSCVALFGGILLDFSKMNKILELDLENLTLTVEPGVLLMDINSYLASTGLFYPPDPGEKSATIGGNVNTNAGGMKAMKYGATKENILGLEIVFPDGIVDKTGGKIVKVSSGYNLQNLIIGSEGTLAVVTKATLRLLPVPKYNVTLLVPFDALDDAIDAVPEIIKSKVMLTAIEFAERDVILSTEQYIGKKFPHNSASAYLILSFDGNTKQSLEEAYDEIAHKCIKAGAIDVFISNTPERNASIWTARGTFLEAIKSSTTELDECDVVVPRNTIAKLIKFANSLSEKYDVRIKSFGHAGDGNIHIYALKDNMKDEEWKKKLSLVFDELYLKTFEYGGAVSGEHGIGCMKKEYLARMLSRKSIEISKKIKDAFDPNNIMNPGKICCN